MNFGDTFLPSSTVANQIGDPADGLTNRYDLASTERSSGRKDPGREYDTTTDSNLRSRVERRFMRMSEVHDRIRTKLLRRRPPEVE